MTKSSQEFFIGRQAIFNHRQQVKGYELLYRDGESDSARIKDGDQATVEVIVNSFIEMGIDAVTDGQPAYINLTRSFLEGGKPMPLEPKQVVLEILEDIPAEPALVEAVSAFKAKGFKFALDDYVCEEGREKLFDLADIIKVDVMSVDEDKIEQEVKLAKRKGKQLLAEKVETQEVFERYKELGFDLFQGYFFAKPKVLSGKRAGVNAMPVMQTLARLYSDDVDVAELETIIGRDVSLSYKLLRYINSPAFSLSRQVSSLREAIMLLGLNAMKCWILLIILSGIKGKPSELLKLALLRAKLCEMLAASEGEKNTEPYFVIGLFSVIDAMLDLPMEEAMAPLPLSDTIKGAILEGKGLHGTLLRCARALANGMLPASADTRKSPKVLQQMYLDAVKWAEDTIRDLQG